MPAFHRAEMVAISGARVYAVRVAGRGAPQGTVAREHDSRAACGAAVITLLPADAC
jgi:hypothetical protein